MESDDRALILRMSESHQTLKRLYREHEALEQRLLKYRGQRIKTITDQLEEKRLKVKKLRGVDAMMRIIQPVRAEAEEVESRV